MDHRLPVLWLYGPPGVGKSTVAWQLFTELSGGGLPTGYVDLDQLGMCYSAPTSDVRAPEPASDPGRHRLQARNLNVVAANFQAAGARCLVVSGVTDAVRGPDADLVPRAALTLCRLRAEPHDLRRRVVDRGWPEQPDPVLEYADALDRHAGDGLCIDTTGRTVAEVLEEVRRRTGGWPAAGPVPTIGRRAAISIPGDASAAAAGKILWLCGATAVGKSTVGWQVYEHAQAAVPRAAFVDLDQIGFYRPEPDDENRHRLRAANLAALWSAYRARGAQRLVVAGPVERPEAVSTYRAALPAGVLTVVRLDAGPEQLAERVVRRGAGEGPGLAGDQLTGQPQVVLRRLAADAAAEAGALAEAGVGDLAVDTDGRPVPELVEEIVRRTGFLDRARPRQD